MKKTVLISTLLLLLNVYLSAQDWEALNYSLGDFGLASPHMGVSHDNMKIAASFSFKYVRPMQVSTDGGQNWTETLDKRVKSIQFDDDGNIYALHESKDVIVFNGFLYKSSDNGATWDEILDVDDYVETVGFKVTGDGQIYVPSNGGLKYSPDGGDTWSDISCPSVPYGVLKTSSGRLIITTYNSGIKYSDDNGATWSDAEGEIGNITFGFLQEHPNNGNIYVCSFGGVMESTDNGGSFTLKDVDPWIAMNIKEFEISNAGKFYFYGLYGVFESTDAVTWDNISGNLPAGNGYDMQLTDDHIYVMVDSMIYKREIATGPAGIMSKKYHEIDMNVWPNPSNGAFQLALMLEKREEVSIWMTDMTGSVVYTQNPGALSNGYHQIMIQIDGLPNGIYLVNVQTPTETGTQRIEIIK